jgi:hypothetical protein
MANQSSPLVLAIRSAGCAPLPKMLQHRLPRRPARRPPSPSPQYPFRLSHSTTLTATPYSTCCYYAHSRLYPRPAHLAPTPCYHYSHHYAHQCHHPHPHHDSLTHAYYSANPTNTRHTTLHHWRWRFDCGGGDTHAAHNWRKCEARLYQKTNITINTK